MKKIFKISVVALGFLLLGAMFSSCNTNIDPMNGKVAYVAEGSVSGGVAASLVVANFQAAINGAVGSGYVQPNDSKVIAACDKVHNSLKDDKSLDGSVSIVKKPSSGSQTVIKKYTYKKSK